MCYTHVIQFISKVLTQSLSLSLLAKRKRDDTLNHIIISQENNKYMYLHIYMTMRHAVFLPLRR